jgi:hypothetical protein
MYLLTLLLAKHLLSLYRTNTSCHIRLVLTPTASLFGVHYLFPSPTPVTSRWATQRTNTRLMKNTVNGDVKKRYFVYVVIV